MYTETLKLIFKEFVEPAPGFYGKQLVIGHINQTYLIHNGDEKYILQAVNTDVFPNVDVVTQNALLVANHLKSVNYPHEVAGPLPSRRGGYLYDGKWRLFPYIKNTQVFEKVKSPEQAFQAAKFLGEFYSYLDGMDIDQLKPGIPGFIDFEKREKAFLNSIILCGKDRVKHADKVQKMILAFRDILTVWQDKLKEMPERIIHADPKVSNFLFDENDENKIVALIDWDTLMPGPILYDFGDMVRSYTALLPEDSLAGDKYFSVEHYEALKKGFLFFMEDKLTKIELESLDLAAEVVIYIQAMRFLTDYCLGDVYYAVEHPVQNLERAINQMSMLVELKQHLKSLPDS